MKGLKRFARVVVGQALGAALVATSEAILQTSIPSPLREMTAVAIGAAANAIAKEAREKEKRLERKRRTITHVL